MKMSELIEFEKLHNTRDLGGIETSDGRMIKKGCFIRSGHLSGLDNNDSAKIKELVSMIIDFRTEEEKNEQPDSGIEGVVNIQLPIIDTLTPGITREESSYQEVIETMIYSPEASKEYMSNMYRGFANEFPTSQYAKFVRLLLNNYDKAVLWHCTAGKDRAGIASVIVEEILGVPRETILKDYMMTNEYIAADTKFLYGFIKKSVGITVDDEIVDKSLKYLFGADEDYIKSYYTAVEEKYGTFENFIHDGLGLSDKAEEILRNKYLEI